ncbi:MAG TPA: antibiotic biosynthesis monooxygenase [Acidimicrobiales bacterium]|nr:antibiotic biosynthesis monooxygenase [Acidimicrobiales bacterium]
MSFVAINAITVPSGSGDELAKRFAARAGKVDDQDGFEEFQLLKPVDEKDTWLVYTRWRDQPAFEAWVSSMAFGQGHAQPEGASRPVASGAELWQFSVEQRSPAP